ALDKYIEHGIFYLPDIKALLPKIELLIELGLFELIKLDNLDQIYSKHDEKAIAFFNLALKQKERVKRVFGITISEVSPVMTLIQNLLVKVGIKLTATRKRVNGDRQYLYQINRQAYQDKDRAIVLTALESKYQTVRSEYLAKNENSNSVPSVAINIETDKEGVGQSDVDESSQNAVPSVANYIETDKVGVGQSNIEQESQTAVPSVANYIETDQEGVGQSNVDESSQNAVPSDAIYIETDRLGVGQNPPNQAEQVAVNEPLSEIDRGNLLTLLLTAIEDLESQRIRFTSKEYLNNFITEIEITAGAIEPQLFAACPDYFERLVVAVANLKLEEPDPLNELTQIEIKSDEDLKVGDRFYHSLFNSYGIVMGLMPISGRASVLFDGEVTTKNISGDRLVKLEMFSCDRSQLLTTVNKLKEILANQGSLDSIRDLGVDLFKAAQQYLAQTVGAKLVAQLAFAIKSLDYELYMRFF
nr:hypothetical protein [Prochloraceae cyanobacterium]